MKFTAETGIEVTYLEDINANEEFFAASLAGPLDAGLPTDWDIVVLTDWMIGRLVRLGWLDAIDKANTPNFVANLAPTLCRPHVRPRHEVRRAVAVRHDRPRASTRT